MVTLETLAFYVIKQIPLKSIVTWCAQKKRKWASLPVEQCERAREEIKKLHARPKGHAWWENKHTGEYQYDLSVIVPFYNTEKYARRCIDSILNQESEYTFEVILVDDGSQDGCGEILDSYRSCGNVRVIHKPNGGLSDARNSGIKIAQGEYILFVDSDDYLYPDAIQPLMRTAKEYNADIVEGGFTTFEDRKVKSNYIHQFQASDRGRGMFGYACGKVFKTLLFEKYCFPKGYWFEDTVIGGLIFPEATCSVTIPDMVYYYYVNQDGITSRARSNPKCIDTYYIIEEIYEALEHYGLKAEPSFQRAAIWQLSKYIYNRCHNIGERNLQNVFILSSELAEQHGVLDLGENTGEYSFWEMEVCEAFINKQYKRWKIASLMM